MRKYQEEKMKYAAEILTGYFNNPPKLIKTGKDLLKIINDPACTDDEKEAALYTLEDLIFGERPAEHIQIGI